MVRSPNEWRWDVEKSPSLALLSAGMPFESTTGHFRLMNWELLDCGNIA